MSNDWPGLVQKYIVHGEIPRLQNPYDAEEPETYLRRLYNESDDLGSLRRELISAIDTAFDKENFPALGRALRLTKLIPHADFADTLQNIFFTARGRSQRGENRDEYKEIALLSVKSLYTLQPKLPPSETDGSFREQIWISLLKDKEYAIAGYNGLRYFSLPLALQQLPLLLKHSELTQQDLRVILRGTRRDLESAGKDLQEALMGTIAQLTEEDLLKSQPPLRAAFGDETIDAVIKKARDAEEEELKRKITLKPQGDEEEVAQNVTSSAPPTGGRALRPLRKQLFLPLTTWLNDRIPVFGTSIWLVDREEKRVHFMWQTGLHDPEPEPPPALKFGEYVSGTVAESRRSIFRDLDSDEGPPVYKHDELWERGVREVFSVLVQEEGAQGNGTKEPSLELVVNFFSDSLGKLQRLENNCVDRARVVARTAQYVLAKYTDNCVANLTTQLTKAPVLEGAALTFNEAVSKAIPFEEKLPFEEERVALYLYHSDLRRHVLYAVYNSREGSLSFKFQPGKEPPKCLLDEKFSEQIAKRTSALRIMDIKNTDEATIHTTPNGSPIRITPDLSQLGLDNLREDQGISYLGVVLREPAPAESRFLGRMVGLVEKYRIIKKDGGRVFTPIGEHILTEIVKPAAQPLINALEQEMQLYGSVTPQEEEKAGASDIGISNVDSTFRKAEDEFQSEAADLLDSWYITDHADRVFVAFRILYNKCKAYWTKRGSKKFDDPEREARRAFQEAVLNKEALVLEKEPCFAVTPDLLTEFGVANKDHVEILSSLGIVLVPLVYRGRPNGLIGLEFDSANRITEAVGRIESEKDGATRFVRARMMRTWLDYRPHLASIFATFLESFLEKAAEEGWVSTSQAFFNFVASGRADVMPVEKSYNELAALAIKRLTSDDKCVFLEECENWNNFVKGGHLNAPTMGKEPLLAVPSAVRMVLATSTAPMLWGETANVSLIKDGGRAGWSQLKIDVPSSGNGHGDVQKQALAFAWWMSEYRGWICDRKDTKNGITIMLPHVDNMRGIPSCD